MDSKDRLWQCFATGILECLTVDDDPNLWEVAVREILANAEYLCQSYRGPDRIFSRIGSCSHWLSPHNKGSWFKDDVKFAWATGYGSSGSAIFGLPEFDWSLIWEWNKVDDLWNPVPRASGRRSLLFRVALPARTARHERAVVHTLWMPGSPTMPKEKFLQGYAFKKINGIWRYAATAGGESPYDLCKAELTQ